jgi:hypothetical protein
MPWFRMDIHWYEDPKVETAAVQATRVSGAAGTAVIAAFPVLMGKAKAEADGGTVEISWRKLSQEIFAGEDDTRAAIAALVSAGVLSCPVVSDTAATVAFDPMSWKRWQEAARKAASREGGQTA